MSRRFLETLAHRTVRYSKVSHAQTLLTALWVFKVLRNVFKVLVTETSHIVDAASIGFSFQALMSKRSGSGITRLGASVSLASRGSQSAGKLPAAIPGTAHPPTTAFQTFQAGRGLAVPVIAFAMGMSPTLSHLRSLTMMAGLQGNYFDILQHKDKLPGVPPLWLPFRRKPCFLNVSPAPYFFTQIICAFNSKNV